jgi:predicted lysophospholipase L1 biosynthesis ABC-type transport system permease subunit
MMHIVGEAVFASFSRGTFSATGLGSGAAVSASVLSVPSDTQCTPTVTCYNFFLLRYRPGTDLRAASARLEQVVTAAGCPPGFCSVIGAQRPRDIENYSRVRNTPLVLAAVLALLAVAMLAHVLLAGASRRRRDLAVLKTLGLTMRQVSALVALQATTIAGAGLALGIPLGVIAGRWAWTLFARSLGAPTATDIPLFAVLLVVPITLALANTIAAAPAWRAGRAPAAPALRTG